MSEEYILDQTFGWLKRKYEWGSKREYDARRAKQYDTRAAILDSIDLLIGQLFGSDDHKSMLLKPYEEAIKGAKAKLTENANNEGVDTSQWWKGSETNENNN